jgi:hypothetical protein
MTSAMKGALIIPTRKVLRLSVERSRAKKMSD